jgi:hypothetical protein
MPTKAAVIGDVHGNADLLIELISKIRLKYGDVDLYSVGDLVDRGPDSKSVLDICIKNGVMAVIGNHETWLHQFISTGFFEGFALHPVMGGKATLRSYGITDFEFERDISAALQEALPQSHRDFINSMAIWIRFEAGGQTYRLTHAGLDKPSASVYTAELERVRGQGANVPTEDSHEYGDELLRAVAKTQSAVLMWTGCNLRNPNVYHFPDDSCQVFGHTPVGRSPIVTKRWIALDTGCGKNPPNTLSAVILPDMEVISVNSLTDKVGSGEIRDFTMD